MRNRMVRATEYSCLNKDRDADEEGEEDVYSGQAVELVDDQEMFCEEDKSELDFCICCLVSVNGDDDLYKDDKDDDDEDVQERVEDEDEDPCEKRVDSLAELPNANVSTYPQANAHYFATIKYVQKDKFTVSTMLFKDLVLPTMESIND